MRIRTLLVVLGLAAAGVNGDLFEVIGLNPKVLAEIAGIKLAPANGGSDGLNPCNITAPARVEEASQTCLAEIEAAEAADEDSTGGRGGKGKKGKKGDKGDGGGGKKEKGGRKGRKKRQAGGRGGRRGGKGRKGGGRGGMRPAEKNAAVELCVFQKLGLYDADGVLVLDNIKQLVNTYRGAESGKKIMIRMTEICFETIGDVESDQQVSALMGCVRRSMRSACPAHDLKLQSPALALITTKKAADGCLDTLEAPPKTMWAGVRCGAEQAIKMADSRLEALASSRKRRSPKKGKKGGKGKDAEEGGGGAEERRGDREEGGDGGRKGGKKADRGGANQGEAEDEMAAVKERVEALFGQLDGALEATRQGILGVTRCIYESSGVLDGDDVSGDRLKAMLAEFGGDDKMKTVVSEAIDKCIQIDPNVDAMTECLNFELSVTCSAAMAPKESRGGRRGGKRGGGRRRAVAGRPAKLAALKLPAHLTP